MALSIDATYDIADVIQMCVSEGRGLLFCGTNTGLTIAVTESTGVPTATYELCPDNVYPIYFDDETDKLFVGNDSGKIVVYDYNDQSILTTFEAVGGVGTAPRGVKHGNHIVITGLGIQLEWVWEGIAGGMDPVSFTLELNQEGKDIAVDGDFLYVIDSAFAPRILKIHGASQTISATYTGANTVIYQAIACDTVLNKIFVSDSAAQGYTVYNNSLSVLDTIESGKRGVVAVDAGQETVFMGGSGQPEVMTGDTRNYGIGTTVDVQNLNSIAVDTNLTVLWTASATNDKVQKLSGYDLGC